VYRLQSRSNVTFAGIKMIVLIMAVTIEESSTLYDIYNIVTP